VVRSGALVLQACWRFRQRRAQKQSRIKVVFVKVTQVQKLAENTSASPTPTRSRVSGPCTSRQKHRSHPTADSNSNVHHYGLRRFNFSLDLFLCIAMAFVSLDIPTRPPTPPRETTTTSCRTSYPDAVDQTLDDIDQFLDSSNEVEKLLSSSSKLSSIEEPRQTPPYSTPKTGA
jgi:hypothetical protein